MKREATVNRKGEMTDGRKKWKNRERNAAARERDDERVSARPREGEREKPSTLHICSIIHHIPRSVARTHTHSASESPTAQRKSLSHACKQEQRTPKTQDHIANKNTHYQLSKHQYISARPSIKLSNLGNNWIFANKSHHSLIIR